MPELLMEGDPVCGQKDQGGRPYYEMHLSWMRYLVIVPCACSSVEPQQPLTTILNGTG